MDKPAIFIGSSSEGLPIAEALFSYLSQDTKPKLWTHNLFQPGQYPIEVLERQIRSHDFAILLASPDDQIVKRGVTSPAIRDNLLFEFGLFSGALGRKRAFFVCPDNPTVELPSDLVGITVAIYNSDRSKGTVDEIAAAVQIACQQIRSAIIEEWTQIQEARVDVVHKARASEKGKAVERLHLVVTKLRDAVMAVQRDTFAAMRDEHAFQKVKDRALLEIREITASFHDEAKLIGVLAELEALSEATINALRDLPFPSELSIGRDAGRQKIIHTGLGALNTFLGGGDPFRHVENDTAKEVDIRINSLKERYIDWWERYYPQMEAATLKLQDRLFQTAMELATIAY